MTSSIDQLATCAHTRLAPFGLLVEAADGPADLRRIPPTTLADLTVDNRVLVLRGFPLLDVDDLVAYCERWGDVLTWDFGKVLNLVVREDPKNYLFTRGPVPYHWDGAFAAATPDYFLFQCRHAPGGAGGETVFCDTTRAIRAMPRKRLEAWSDVTVTYRTDKAAHYGGDVTWPLVSRHPRTGEPILRYAEPLPEKEFLNPLFVEVNGLADGTGEQLLDELRDLLYRPEFCYAHGWRDGDVVVVDNHALLHGRRPFLGDASRWLERIQIIERAG